MKAIYMLTLASLLVGGAATGFAATSSDSVGAPSPTATTGTSGQTVQPGVANPNGSTVTTQNGPYATPVMPPSGTAKVGPTGSLTRDANNPKGRGQGGGDNGGSGGAKN